MKGYSSALIMFLFFSSIVFSKNINDIIILKGKKANYPYFSGHIFRYLCDFVFEKTNCKFKVANVCDGDTILVGNKSNILDYFFRHIHPKIKAKYILVTHNGLCLGGLERYRKYLEDDTIVAWFGKNMTIEHEKAFPIPVGLNPWSAKKKFIDAALEKLPAKKNILLYMNFALGAKKNRRGPIRRNVYNMFKNKKFCTKARKKKLQAYLLDLARSKFVLSPEGNGIDCFRTWEAMLLGSIPVVLTSKLDPLFEDLPVLIVEDWEDITEEFLMKKYEEMNSKEYNIGKLYTDYWLEKIGVVQEEIRLAKGELDE